MKWRKKGKKKDKACNAEFRLAWARELPDIFTRSDPDVSCPFSLFLCSSSSSPQPCVKRDHRHSSPTPNIITIIHTVINMWELWPSPFIILITQVTFLCNNEYIYIVQYHLPFYWNVCTPTWVRLASISHWFFPDGIVSWYCNHGPYNKKRPRSFYSRFPFVGIQNCIIPLA